MLSHPHARCGWILALASTGAAGCSVSVEPIDVGAGCPQQPARPTRLEAATEANLIDDFEHDGTLLPRRGGRDGTWASASDGSADEIETHISDRCAARGLRAGHFAASGLSGWGATWSALMRGQTGSMTLPYDATAYGGVSFWAALSAEFPAPFSLPVGVTTPPDGASSAVTCPKCLNYYSTTISLDHNWRRFELRFSDLVQLSNGNPMVALRLDQLVGLTFWPEGDFDIWVDDVRFEP
jgi:hypothetical protein